jgi:hypothetical protein
MSKEKCPCGKAKQPEAVVCRTCWDATPLEVRQRFITTIDLAFKRELAKQLLADARAGKPAVEPEPRQLQPIL